MEPIRDLNDLRNGLYKRWVWRDMESHWRGMDCVQKINYSIQDLNHELDSLSDRPMKEVVFVISLVDWIRDAYNSICKLLRPDALNSFKYQNEAYAKKTKAYLTAMRSFVVAHPLSTSRHEKYGFDGDMICVDIKSSKDRLALALPNRKNWLYIGIEGVQEYGKDIPHDFLLMFYSKKMDKMRFFKYMGASYSDLYEVARVYIDKLYALDKYLGKQKKADYIKRNANRNDKTGKID